ncbi:hypothetical protein MHU86_951 [Fragilaria crotonensis]|nr:hypothetical protein MHU86_951 [Fragilaria crotonensis]
MMNRGFLRGATMPRLWMASTGSQTGRHTGLIKYNRRVFSEGSPKEAEKIASHVNQKPTWLQKFFSLKEMPEKYTFQWYREMVLICTVFAVTGSSTMFLVRPAMSNILGIEGGLIEGPTSYRVASLVIMTPLYSTLLVCVGTVFGRHAYFRHFAVKMFTRFGIPPELMDSTFHETAKKFRKW